MNLSQPMAARPIAASTMRYRSSELGEHNSFFFVSLFGCVGVQARANGKRKRLELRRAYFELQIDHKTADQPKGNLRDNKPKPVDARIQNWADNPSAE